MELNVLQVEGIIRQALSEDIGSGDVTTNTIIPKEATTEAIIYAKEDGVVAGLPVVELVFSLVDPLIKCERMVEEGTDVTQGQELIRLKGPARGILTGERVALNFLQRLSGIATKTRKIVEGLTYYKTKIVDTRKTTPGLRVLEKYAVVMGGGRNHRFGLYDAILIKDNHIKVAGGIQKAISLARSQASHTMKIEVEVESLEGVQEALDARADIIMLDNMDLEMMGQALDLIQGKAIVEASGGITEERVLEMAKLGVDLISMGSLTHSVKALDISLDVGEIKLKQNA